MAKDLQITPAEWRVMRIVWTLDETTSREVTEILQRKVDWKAATIKTLLHRLVTKGALTTTRRGRAFIYHPAVAEQETMCQAADDLFQNICERRVGRTLNHVLNQVELSKTDIKNLQATLDKKLATAPDHVQCNCVPGRPMNC